MKQKNHGVLMAGLQNLGLSDSSDNYDNKLMAYMTPLQKGQGKIINNNHRN